ncbi:STAS/SEC14 domain-containing protein [Hyphomonas sp.]|uniref:STAS/SEC14 domain-containing protein n=1 Tax=Hyphomonas sp. TaxID=87 RepID=UPI00391AD51F
MRAIRRVESVRADLVTFEINGKISGADMGWMAGQVDAAFERLGEIDLMLIMTNFEGAEAGAIFNPEAAGVMLKSLSHVRKYCVVGAPIWARAMIEASKWVTPVEERTFPLTQLERARRWVDA